MLRGRGRRASGSSGQGNGAGGAAGAGAVFVSAALCLRSSAPLEVACVPRFHIQCPVLFCARSPAEVRPELARLPCGAEAMPPWPPAPSDNAQPRAASPSLPASPTHAELRLWLFRDTGCLFACMMAPTSLSCAHQPHSGHGTVSTWSSSHGAWLESRAAERPGAQA